jgi:hypothetical protein
MIPMADSKAVSERTSVTVTGRRRMADRFGFWLGMANLVVLVPFAILPMTLLRTDHMTFHLVYIPCLIIGLWVIWQLKGLAPNRALRVLAWILLAAQSIALLGHAGELFAVMQHGGFAAPYEVFEEPDHVGSAQFALPAIMLTLLTVIVIDLTAGIQGMFHRAHRVELHGPGLRK